MTTGTEDWTVSFSESSFISTLEELVIPTTDADREDRSLETVSTKEAIFLLSFLGLTSVLILFLNSSVLFVTWSNTSLCENPLYWLLTCQVVCDMLTPFIYAPVAVIFIEDREEVFDGPWPIILVALRHGISILVPIHALTLLTLERYVYICKPVCQYGRYLGPKKVAVATCFMVLIAVSTNVVSILTSMVKFSKVQLTFYYDLSESGSLTNFTMVPLYAVGPAVVQGFCLGSILRVAISQSRRIHTEAQASMSGLPDGHFLHLQTKGGIFKAIFGVARLCGIYWITFVASTFMATTAILGKGYTRGNSDFILLVGKRYITVVFMSVVPLLNPVICIRNIPELRARWLRAFGIKSQ